MISHGAANRYLTSYTAASSGGLFAARSMRPPGGHVRGAAHGRHCALAAYDDFRPERGNRPDLTGPERRIARWEHEAVLETVQARLDQHPEKMTMRRSTVEHPFGTIKCWMGATHFLMTRLPKVATEMALNVLAYNMKRVMAIIGVAGLLEALAA